MITASLAREASRLAAQQIVRQTTDRTICSLDVEIMGAVGQGFNTISYAIPLLPCMKMQREVTKNVISYLKKKGYTAYKAKERFVVIW